MDLFWLWVACVMVFVAHEFGHFIFAVWTKKFDGFFFNAMFCGINFKFPIPVKVWYLIISAGIWFGIFFAVLFPTDLPIETMFLICFALTISIMDLLMLYMVRQEEKSNCFFKEITDEDTLVISFRKLRTGEAVK